MHKDTLWLSRPQPIEVLIRRIPRQSWRHNWTELSQWWGMQSRDWGTGKEVEEREEVFHRRCRDILSCNDIKNNPDQHGADRCLHIYIGSLRVSGAARRGQQQQHHHRTHSHTLLKRQWHTHINGVEIFNTHKREDWSNYRGHHEIKKIGNNKRDTK